jgi:hypothetical protein
MRENNNAGRDGERIDRRRENGEEAREEWPPVGRWVWAGAGSRDERRKAGGGYSSPIILWASIVVSDPNLLLKSGHFFLLAPLHGWIQAGSARSEAWERIH